MSDMRHYLGTYQYLGEFKTKEDDTSELEIREFTYYGRHYKPAHPLKFTIHPEEDGYIVIECDETDGRVLGIGLQEALGNALMMTATKYERLVSVPDAKAVNVQELRNIFKTWEVVDVDRKAQ